MSALSCYIAAVVLPWLLQAYILLLLVYAIASWIPDIRGPWLRYVAMVIEPLLMPLRRVIPPLGGFDLSFLVLLLVVEYPIRSLVNMLASSVCSIG